MGRVDEQRSSDIKLLPHRIHRCQNQFAVFLLNDLLRHHIAGPGSHILGRGSGFGASCPAYHVGILSVLYVLGSIEELAFQPLRLAVGSVLAGRRSIPQGIVLSGIGHIPGIADFESVRAFQVPEISNGIGKNHAVIVTLRQIFIDGILQDPRGTTLRSRDRHGDQTGIRIVVALGIPEVILLPQLGRRIDIPPLNLLKGIQIIALGDHDLFLKFHIRRAVMTGIEQIVDIIHFHHRAGSDPGILPAAAGGFQHRRIDLGVGDKIRSGCQINGMVVGIAAILQIVDVVDTVLIIGHGIAHIRLVDAIHPRQEVSAVFVCGLLAAGRSKGRKILIVPAGLNFIGSLRVPQGIQRKIRLDLIFFKIPGSCHSCVGVPALQHIAIPLDILRLGDLAALFQSQRGRIFAAVKIRVKGNGIRAAGLATAQQQAQNQQRPDQAFFHNSLLMSVALTEGM